MQTQLENIVDNFRYLTIKLNELDELAKTLKNSFDDSLMASEDCYYLQSIIHILRQKTNKSKDFADSLNSKIIKFQLDNKKFPLHK